MKNLVLVAIAATAGYAGWQRFLTKSPAQAAYEKFTDAVMWGRFDEARKLASGPRVEAQLRDLDEAMQKVRVGQLLKISFRVKSESRGAAPKTARIEATAVAVFDPPGVTSGMGGARAFHDQSVELTDTGSGWKVSSFEDHLIKTIDWKGQPM